MSEATEKADIRHIKCLLCSETVSLKSTELFSDARCPKCDTLLWFRHREMGDIAVLSVVPETRAESMDVMRVGKVLLDSSESTKVVINLEGVKFISSSFIAGLIACHRRFQAAERRFVLCGVHPVVMEGFVGARLDKVFEIFEDEKAALDALNEAQE